jgi:integrase
VTSTHVSFLSDASQTRRLLDAAAALPDNSRARQRGPAYRAIFALCYGLGLRAGEARGPRLRDIDTDRCLVVVRGGKFGKSRLVLHGRASPGSSKSRPGAARPAVRRPALIRRPPAGRNRYVFHQADNLTIESVLSRTLGRWSG